MNTVKNHKNIPPGSSGWKMEEKLQTIICYANEGTKQRMT